MAKKKPVKKPEAKKSKKDSVAKHDWPALKQEFFHSTFTEVKAFLQDRLGHYDGNMARHSTGWAEEKKVWKDKLIEESLEQFKANKAARIARMLEMVNQLTEREIVNALHSEYISKDDLKKLWEISRTEAELPTRIIHSKNENLNFDAGKIRTGLLDKLKNKLNGRPSKSAS